MRAFNRGDLRPARAQHERDRAPEAPTRRAVMSIERYGDHTGEGIEIRLPVTQEDLGGWTASSRAGVAALILIDVLSRRFRDANRKRVQFGALDTIAGGSRC
jgi:hypothetical protein